MQVEKAIEYFVFVALISAIAFNIAMLTYKPPAPPTSIKCQRLIRYYEAIAARNWEVCP